MKGQVIFNLFPKPPRMLLNPYSRPSKEFLPDEIEQLRGGQLFTIDEEKKVGAGTAIQIGMPADYPTALVSALKKYGSTRKEIKEMYLAFIHNINSGEAPHLLIGISAHKNLKHIFEETGEIIKHLIPKGEYADMINMAGGGKTVKVLNKKEYRIY